jgi:hypothetical protein
MSFPRPLVVSPLSAKNSRVDQRSMRTTMAVRVPVSRLMVEWQQPDALGGFGAVYFAETTDGDQVIIHFFLASSEILAELSYFSRW